MKKTTYFGNPWIGMFVKTNDNVTMLPIDSMKKLEDVVAENLKTEIIKTGMKPMASTITTMRAGPSPKPNSGKRVSATWINNHATTI